VATITHKGGSICFFVGTMWVSSVDLMDLSWTKLLKERDPKRMQDDYRFRSKSNVPCCLFNKWMISESVRTKYHMIFQACSWNQNLSWIVHGLVTNNSKYNHCAEPWSLFIVVHTCNLSYWGGRDRRIEVGG
jgi:hypothetical protein